MIATADGRPPGRRSSGSTRCRRPGRRSLLPHPPRRIRGRRPARPIPPPRGDRTRAVSTRTARHDDPATGADRGPRGRVTERGAARRGDGVGVGFDPDISPDYAALQAAGSRGSPGCPSHGCRTWSRKRHPAGSWASSASPRSTSPSSTWPWPRPLLTRAGCDDKARRAAHLPRRRARGRQDVRDAREARRRRERGTDVVVGWSRRTAGRGPPICSTAGGAPAADHLPRWHRIDELDVDAVLARRPEVALVDELAHTNAPGSRHPKRWQDVEDILDAGIDVLCTVNVQHLESLNDVVRADHRCTAAGDRARRGRPPRRADRAGRHHPGGAAPRMAHGNVYGAGKVDAALANYFQRAT